MTKKVAMKVTENRDTRTVEEAITFAVDAAQEVYDATKGHDEHLRFKEAKAAYRNCMPLLETRASVKLFVACVAQGVHYDFFSPEEAKLLLYGVQVWLQVNGSSEGMVTGG